MAIDEYVDGRGQNHCTAIGGAWSFADPYYNCGAAYLFNGKTGSQLCRLEPWEPSEDARFGWAVDVGKTNAVVGAYRKGFLLGEDVIRNVGEAYLFDAQSGYLTHTLHPDSLTEGTCFGMSTGISGNTAIVGSYGSAYLFDVQKGIDRYKFTGSVGDRFGTAVGIDRNIAIVGAYGADNYRGTAYLYNTYTGEMLHQLNPAGGAAEDGYFGREVAICGNIAVVGAPYENDYTGAAYVFNATTGEQLAKLTAPDGAMDDEFGRHVAVFGNVAVIGAIGHTNYSGAAYMFNATTGQQIGCLDPLDATELFGAGVGICQSKIIVGGQHSFGSGCGAAYVFEAPDHTTMDMPEMPTENYKQFEAGWRDDVYGLHTAGDGFTMRGYGCAVTSMSMALHYAGYTDQDPGTLNSLMACFGGFSGKGNVLWGAATRAAANYAQLPNINFRNVVSKTTEGLDELLATGNPVIVRVTSRFDRNGKPKYHFVLVTGKEDGHYIIQDPGSSNITTLDHYLAIENKFETRGYVCDPEDVSELDVAVSCDLSGEDAGSGICIRVTDPFGNVTYYDSEGNVVEEIPGSVFSYDSYGDYFSDEPDTDVCQQVMISQPEPGDYQVLISCEDGTSTPYTVTISTFNENGSVQLSEEYTGFLGTGDSEMYSFSYTPEPSTLSLLCIMAVMLHKRRKQAA
ncbi:MAG: C39 family peptidase [Phycisphaerae bacterium]|nr:C39 family peptidase [Phycisphaerae bacterium]